MIRKVTNTGVTTTYATGISTATGITIDPQGNLYVSEQGTNSVIKIDHATQAKTTFASNVINPKHLAIDAGGNIYVVEVGNQQVSKYNPTGNLLATYPAVTPSGVAVDARGNIYVGETNNFDIIKIIPGTINLQSVFAGTTGQQGRADGAPGTATIGDPQQMAFDNVGNLYLVDDYLLRKVTTDGVITTVAGGPYYTGTNTDGVGTASSFSNLRAVAVGPDGNLYIGALPVITRVAVNSFNITPTLPNGLAFNTTTGAITGAPQTVTQSTSYKVGVSNGFSLGNSSAFTIAVTPPVPPAITYDPSTVAFTVGTAGTTVAPTNTGSAVSTSYTVGTLASQFNSPRGIAVDAAGNTYVTDYNNQLIIKITPAGVKSTFAGSGTYGSADGQGTAATFAGPRGLAIDQSGNLYVSDEQTHIIRKIDPAGNVTTLVGMASSTGYADGIGVAAKFNYPAGLAIDAQGNLYVADSQNNRIRKVNTTTGEVTSLAGQYSFPTGVTVDAQGNVYIAEQGNQIIRKVTAAGVSSVFAGSAGNAGYQDGTGGGAIFNNPANVILDAFGSVYVADAGNHLIRKITPAGVVTTVAGMPGQVSEVNGPGASATFGDLEGMAFDLNSNLLLSNNISQGNKTIKKLAIAGFNVAANTPLPVGLALDNNTGIISGTSAVLVPASNYTIVASTGYASASTAINLSVVAPPPPVIAYTPSTVTLLTGTAITPLVVTNTSTVPSGFTIAPALPAGLAIDASTGTISGIPTAIAPAANYVITGSTPYNSGNTTINIKVELPAPVITAITPSAVLASNPGQVTITGTNFGSSLSDINSITYGANGTGTNATNIVFDSPTQVHFTLGTLTAGTNYSVIITVRGKASAATTTTFTGSVAAAISYGSSTNTMNQYTAITPIAVTNAGGPITKSSLTSLVAGGTQGTTNGTGAAASFSYPAGAGVDSQGNIYVADAGNNTIRKITPAGAVSTFAGTAGVTGSANGIGALASFSSPQGLAVDGIDNIYVADQGNNTIRKITPAGAVTTLAGSQNSGRGSTDGTGVAASFNQPSDVAVDAQGNVYVADLRNNTVRKITAAGVVTTIAGVAGQRNYVDGTIANARFGYPSGITLDAQGNIYVTDSRYRNIRKIATDGTVSTLATNFSSPTQIRYDGFGSLYVTDQTAQTISKVTLSGVVTTVAGTGDNSNANGDNNMASFNYPFGLAVNATGNLYVTDSNGNDVRKIIVGGYGVTPALPAGLSIDDNTGTITGLPTVSSPATTYTVRGANFFSSSTATVSIAVTALPAPAITYTPTSQAFKVNTAAAPYTPGNTSGAAITGGSFASTFAGRVNYNSTIDGTGTAAAFTGPNGVALDATGNLYTADINGNVIRKITPAGVVTTIAGTGNNSNADGSAATASFYNPRALTVDPQGNIYLADGDGDSVPGVVRKLTPNGNTYTVSTIADPNHRFSYPQQLVSDAQGNVYVADQYNNVIIKINPAGLLTNYAGTGQYGSDNGTLAAATFANPIGLTIDAKGNLYVSDYQNNLIRKLTKDSVTTFAGSGSYDHQDGTGLSASFGGPNALAADSLGNIYVSEDAAVIRKITPAGIVSTISGMYQSYGSTNGINSVATFGYPTGLAMDGANNLYVADNGNSLIRKLAVNGFTVNKALPPGLVFNQDNGTITGTPTTVAAARALTVTATNYNGSSSANISIAVSMPAPTVQASNLTFTGTTATSTTVNWANGNGTSRIVFVKAATTGTPAPIDNTTYTANAVFGSGSQIGTTGWYAVYKGTGSSVTITGLSGATNYLVMTQELAGAAGSESYNIATATRNPANIRTISNDATLSNITLSEGVVSPVFSAGIAAYTSIARNPVTSITIKPAASDGNSIVKVNGTVVNNGLSSQAIPLVVGNNTITTVITAQDGTTTKTYTLTVMRLSNVAFLSNLTLSAGTLSLVFSTTTPVYKATVTNATSSITVTPTVTDVNSTVKVSTGTGTVVASGTASPLILLQIGNNPINIAVTAEDGVTTRNYSLTVTRPSNTATLFSLTTSTGALSPAFVSSTFTYNNNVANFITSTTLTPFSTDINSIVTVNGVVVGRGATSAPIPLNVGANAIAVLVTAQDGITTQKYTVNVTRAAPPVSTVATLSNLTLSAGNLTPTFGSSTSSYTASVSNTTSSLTVTPTATDAKSTITVNGTAVTNGSASQPVALNVGNNTITTVVTAQNGNTAQTYTVTVTRAASAVATLSNLTLSAGSLSPAFAAGTTAYTASVNNAITSITVIPTATDANAVVTVNGTTVISGSTSQSIALNVGSNAITTVVISPDGSTTQTYMVNVTRAAPVFIATTGTIAFAALPVKTFNDGDFAAGANISTGEIPVYTSSNTAVATIVNGNIHIVGAGSSTITAAAPANSNFTTAPIKQQLVVNKADQTITFAAIPDLIEGNTYSLAGVTSSAGLPVTLTSTDATIATVTGTTLKAISLGFANIIAASAGNANYNAAVQVAGQQVRVVGPNAEPIIVHQAFSPNGDGINDIFTIEGIKDHPNNKVTLINRNGIKVFEITGYDNLQRGFDGHSNITGAMLQQGTYFYIIEYTDSNGTSARKTGYFVFKY